MEVLFASLWTWLVLVAAVAFAAIYVARRLGRRSKRLTRQRDEFVLGLVALARGQRDAAERALASAVETNDTEALPFLLYGELLAARGDSDRAARLLMGVLARRDLLGEIQHSAEETLVAALVRAGEFQSAQEWTRRFENSAELELEDVEQRARLSIAARAYELAQTLSARVEKRHKARGQRLHALAFAAQAEDCADDDKHDEALKFVRKAIARDDSLAIARALEGQLLLEKGKLDKARHAFQIALELQPSIGLAVYPILEDAHLAAGKVADYEAMIQILLERRANDPIALWALGRHLCRRQHTRDGIAALRASVDAAPSFQLAQQELASTLAKQEGWSREVSLEHTVLLTRCSACLSEDVKGIIRCPVCGQVDTIVFVGAPTGELQLSASFLSEVPR